MNRFGVREKMTTNYKTERLQHWVGDNTERERESVSQKGGSEKRAH